MILLITLLSFSGWQEYRAFVISEAVHRNEVRQLAIYYLNDSLQKIKDSLIIQAAETDHLPQSLTELRRIQDSLELPVEVAVITKELSPFLTTANLSPFYYAIQGLSEAQLEQGYAIIRALDSDEYNIIVLQQLFFDNNLSYLAAIVTMELLENILTESVPAGWHAAVIDHSAEIIASSANFNMNKTVALQFKNHINQELQSDAPHLDLHFPFGPLWHLIVVVDNTVLVGKRQQIISRYIFIILSFCFGWSLLLYRNLTSEQRIRVAEDAKRIQESRATTTLESIADGVIVTDINGHVMYLNPVAEQVTGWSRLDAEGHSVAEVFPAQERVRTKDDNGEESGTAIYFDSVIHTNGITYHIEKSVTALRDDQHGIVGFAWVLRDLTERILSQEELKQAAMVFEFSREGIMMLDKHGTIVRVNRAFTHVTGYKAEEVLGHSQKILRSGRHEEDFYRNIYSVLDETGYWHGEVWQRRKNGEIYPEWLSISIIYDNVHEVKSYVCIFNDITEKKSSEQKIHRLAYYDPLTELPNRTLFNDRLQQALNHAKRNHSCVALLFLDLDRFKYVNDTFGHPAGDYLLQETSRRLNECLREEDTVARMGGDEFTIIMGDIDTQANANKATAKVSTNIIKSLAKPVDIEGTEILVTTSVGIAIYPEDGADATELLRNADTAMYHAKTEGKNNFQFYSQELNNAAVERYILENELRKAVENQEFMLYFQPQYRISDRTLSGMEALMRWERQDNKPVSPSDFIPIAEETGLIVAMGRWLIYEVCRQIREWLNEGYEVVRVGVNISGRQFMDPEFRAMVQQALQQYSIEPQLIELEVTESSLINDIESTIATLDHFKELGLRISIDDFGTGYSSLSYLKRFPADTLKIDSSFVRDSTTGSEGAKIVTAVIAIGHSLNLNVIAEGVETEEQFEYLKKQGCEEVQGYLLSRPLPPKKLVQALSKHE